MIKDLPEKLQTLRAKYHFSQRQVAERIGVSPSIISGYESGERTPSVEVLLALSYLYNCSVDYLLGKRSPEPTTSIDISGLSEKEIQAIHALIDVIRNK